MKFTVKNWAEFQHYKDRAPPWIKLHKGLLDDYDYQCLPLASRALAPMIWLLASENQAGTVDCDSKKLAFRLRTTEKEILAGLTPLIDKGFLIPASDALADCWQGACLETETETETETENTLPPKSAKFDPVSHLVGLGVTEPVVRDWLTVRKTKKAAPTKTAFDDVVREVGKAGISMQTALETCCHRGWSGFKASWLLNDGAAQRGSDKPAAAAFVGAI